MNSYLRRANNNLKLVFVMPSMTVLKLLMTGRNIRSIKNVGIGILTTREIHYLSAVLRNKKVTQMICCRFKNIKLVKVD